MRDDNKNNLNTGVGQIPATESGCRALSLIPGVQLGRGSVMHSQAPNKDGGCCGRGGGGKGARGVGELPPPGTRTDTLH